MAWSGWRRQTCPWQNPVGPAELRLDARWRSCSRRCSAPTIPGTGAVLLPARHRPGLRDPAPAAAPLGAVVPHAAPLRRLARRSGWSCRRRRARTAGSPDPRPTAGSGRRAGPATRNSLHESSPVSPAALRNVCPCAAACWKMKFSACWAPGSASCSSCSQNPQLDVMIWSLSLSIIVANSSNAARVRVGRLVHVDVRARGHRRDVLDVEDRLAASRGPVGWPPSTGIVLRRPAIWLAAVAPK